jgi:hypothetical protein
VRNASSSAAITSRTLAGRYRMAGPQGQVAAHAAQLRHLGEAAMAAGFPVRHCELGARKEGER